MAVRFEKQFETIHPASLRAAIHARTAIVGVVGLGYVGLPLAIAASRAGFEIVGIDLDRERVRALKDGRSYVSDIRDDAIAAMGNSRFTCDSSELAAVDVIVIAVPTPLTDAVPDLSMVKEAASAVARSMSPGTLVILESTTYPGTTEEVIRPILESSGLEAGVDFFVGYSPERIDPGSGRTLTRTPKIVSGIGADACDLVEAFYSQFVEEVVRVPSPREAEMAKLIENTFRHVNIALVNELAILAPHLGVDIWSALDAAATKPFGYMPFWPGPGVGGHCIAIDPSYLSWMASQRQGFGIGFIEHAKEVNNRMPGYVANRIGQALNGVSKPLNGSRILALGVTYKPGVNDVRESPALAVLDSLVGAGANCSFHDPYVPSIRFGSHELHSSPLTEEVLAAQDCVVILTAHSQMDLEKVVRASALIFDARGVTRSMEAPNVVRL